MKFTVVLHSSEHPGNVGAIARVMANFGCTSLVLVNPQCDYLCEEARNRAKHAQSILENATVVDTIPEFDVLVATSGKLGSKDNIQRIPLTPKQLKESLEEKTGSIGLLFGRESCGLSNEELEPADFLVAIPTNEEYPILNLSHSVGILLYELSMCVRGENALANAEQKKRILALIDERLEEMEFPTPEKKEMQRILWQRLIGKGFLSAREAQMLLGFFKKLA